MNESADQNAMPAAAPAATTGSPSASSPGRRTLFDLLAISLGTGLGIGFVPKAPGTFGSLLGPPLVIATQKSDLPLSVLSVVIVVFCLLGIPICSRASRALGKHDPGEVVYDEVAAFWLVFLPQLVTGTPITWQHTIAGFVLFRIFDISKPWPVSRLERLPGGLGIMADDLAAGMLAGAVLFVLPL
ncbi:phosphatidylglycerophosphatase A [bacterium]|nr:phosphatidylglycerophosphatase A [bacterium]